MESKIEKNIRNYVNKVWKDNDDNLGFRIGDNNKIEEIGRLEFTKKELLKYSTLLIDYLNIQPQAEEKKTLEQIRGEFDKERVKEWDRTAMETYKQATQDTPEQKEEWEFDLRNLMYRDGEQLRCAGEGKPYTGEYRELVVSMIKNLLSEREREAREEGFREGADIVESDYIRKVKKLEKRLSKLTTK